MMIDRWQAFLYLLMAAVLSCFRNDAVGKRGGGEHHTSSSFYSYYYHYYCCSYSLLKALSIVIIMTIVSVSYHSLFLL